MFEIEPRTDGPEVTLVLTGELDTAVAYLVYEAVAATVDPLHPRDVVIDLAGVTFCDSTGLGALLRSRQTAAEAGAELVLRAVPERIRTLLQITGLDREFSFRA